MIERRLCTVWLLWSSVALAQIDRATLVGTITDKTGAVVAGAKVEAVMSETGLRRAAAAGATGSFSFSLLPIGLYDVTVSHAGFRTTTVKQVRLGVGDQRQVDVALEISSVESAVTVEEVLAPLDSTSAVLGTVIGSRQMREMPLNGRHWASLMALAPGAINTGDGSQQTIRFVGRSRDDNNWTFDGVDSTGVKDPRQEAALRLV